jgi:hypothetical protein
MFFSVAMFSIFIENVFDVLRVINGTGSSFLIKWGLLKGTPHNL